jgi:hypothetical protein
MKYIIVGNSIKYVAHLHCEAPDQRAALARWREAFPDCREDVFLPEVRLAGEGYRYDGYRYYCGAYQYAKSGIPRYRVLPNTISNIVRAEADGWNVVGYSEYDRTGFPAKVELIKYV